MLFKEVADYYEKLEAVSSRLKMMELLSELLKASRHGGIRKLVYMTQGILAPNFEGIEFGVAEKMLEEAIAAATGYTKGQVESAYKRHGDMGEAAMDLKRSTKLKRMSGAQLGVGEVYDKMLKVATTSGPGSKEAKIRMLAELLASASPLEAKYMARYPIGQLRLGVGDSTILEALSIAMTGDREAKKGLENAYNLCSDMGVVAETLSSKGMAAIRRFGVSLFKPIRPALAERLPTAEQILKKMGGKCAVEQKYDGFRCQIHRDGRKVKIYSRNLEETTSMYPDIAEFVTSGVKAQRIIFEGEALAYNESTEQFLPFQETIQRKRKHDIKEKAEELPLHLFAFDVMLVDGKDYMREPYEERRQALERAIGSAKGISPTTRIIATEPKQLEAFFETSVENGLEGIVAKDLGSPYVAGAREFSWIKMKRSYKGALSDTVDLVIVGYFLGRGSRAAFKFGGLLCAVYNEKRDVFETISKIGTGFTEANMEAFKELLDKSVARSRPARVDSGLTPDFWVEPKHVVTVRADEITKSPMHTCGRERDESGNDVGYALRFPRIVGDGFVRRDKSASDATTTKEIIEMYRQQRRVGVK